MIRVDCKQNCRLLADLFRNFGSKLFLRRLPFFLLLESKSTHMLKMKARTIPRLAQVR